VRYSDDAGGNSFHPAMLAKVTAVDGTPATIHRTYLTPAAEKAAVAKHRKLYSAMPKGSAVRLAPPVGPDLGIAEGIETALACQIIFGVPVWAGICANGVKNFTPPSSVKRLLIFGDNDDNSVGQAAAYALAARLAPNIHTEVHLPTDPGSDWNDVLLRGGR
jgi:putative DNA primase/helicase